MRIATLGDVLLDVVVLLSEPLAPGGDVRASNRAGAGGQAANVAAWAAELGAEARCIAKRGDDSAGELVSRELEARGVELVGPVAEGETGVVVSIVREGDRSLASDRGVAPSLAPEELELGWFACDVLHLSGYALLREPIAAAALRAARLAREQGARVSVDVAAWTEIRSYGPVQFRELLDELVPDVLFATEAEWELLGLGLAASPAKPATPGGKAAPPSAAPGAELDTCIAIRTLWLRDGVAHLQAGGGIVADSDPAAEHEECLAKLRALEAAIELAESEQDSAP